MIKDRQDMIYIVLKQYLFRTSECAIISMWMNSEEKKLFAEALHLRASTPSGNRRILKISAHQVVETKRLKPFHL